MNPFKLFFDLMEPIEEIGSTFDWITPIANEAQGFTKLEYSGSYAGALARKQALEKHGIKCRLEGGGLFTNACVYIQE